MRMEGELWKSHTPTRTKNTNFVGFWSEILHIGALSSIYSNLFLLQSPSPIALTGLGCISAGAWTRSINGSAAPLLPCVWQGLGVSPQGWQENRLRLRPSDAYAHKGRSQICSQSSRISIHKGWRNQPIIYSVMILGAHCTDLLISQLVHVVLISGYLPVLMEGKKEKKVNVPGGSWSFLSWEGRSPVLFASYFQVSGS